MLHALFIASMISDNFSYQFLSCTLVSFLMRTMDELGLTQGLVPFMLILLSDMRLPIDYLRLASAIILCLKNGFLLYYSTIFQMGHSRKSGSCDRSLRVAYFLVKKLCSVAEILFWLVIFQLLERFLQVLASNQGISLRENSLPYMIIIFSIDSIQITRIIKYTSRRINLFLAKTKVQNKKSGSILRVEPKNFINLNHSEFIYKSLVFLYQFNYLINSLICLRKMTHQRNTDTQFEISSNLTPEQPLESFLQEKQVNFKLIFEINSQGKDKKIEKNITRHENTHGNKRRGRLQEKKWSDEETTYLFELHDQMGNRWKEIAKYFNRSDNDVKNHFFAKLRVSLRQLNKTISRLQGPKKQLKNHSIYKIASVCQLKFKGILNQKDSLFAEALKLKRKIIAFNQNLTTEQDALVLWKSITTFTNRICNYRPKGQPEQPVPSQEPKIQQQSWKQVEYEGLQGISQPEQDKHLLRAINQDDFSLTRNLTPNERLLMSISADPRLQSMENFLEKLAIKVPENLFLSPTHSVEYSVFNLNLSDESYFSQNQNLSLYTDFLNQRPQVYGAQKNTL